MSLRARLLLTASAVLVVFVALCGLALENAFREAALAAQRERMQGMVYALLGAADARSGELVLASGSLPEPRLLHPQSGLEAAVLREDGAELWRSPSTVGNLPLIVGPEVGKWRFQHLELPARFVLSFGLRWIGEDQVPRRYTVAILEDPAAYEAQRAAFRRTLWFWLLVVAGGLLAALLAVHYWGLAPLRRLATELRGIESGAQPQIESEYPVELSPLTGALNAMIRNERRQQMRYRNALGDLAHSLKTPLAVLRGLVRPAASGDALAEQLTRMQQIVDHQLATAAAAGRRTLSHPVALRQIADKVVGALAKVHADRRLDFAVEMPATLDVRADPGDLYELLGNCLDNAAKWARTRVRLQARREASGLLLGFEDDGPGFPPEAHRLVQRGARADTRVPGQGLGLALVADIVQAYDGQLELGRSADLGGASVVLRLPA